MRTPKRFEMMHWAKTRGERAPISLAASGISPPGEDEVRALTTPGPDDPNPFSSIGNYYGDPRLRDALAAVHAVDVDAVLVSDGASLANYTALAVLAGPGERAIVETPTYPALGEIPRFCGARVQRWARRPENGWLPSLDELRELLEQGEEPVRVVVITRLHNPSGVDLSPGFLERLAELATGHDFHVVLDEVYLDFVDATPAHRLSDRFVSTGSLTKVYGFGGLRVGWVLGDPDVLAPMKELSFYLAVNGATMSQSVAVRIFEERERFLARARGVASAGHEIVREWVAARPDVTWVEPDGGICAFLRLDPVADTAVFAERLFTERGGAVAEGELFGCPGWIRVAFGGPADELRRGLERIGSALDGAT